jgi:hypothetical protein
MVSDGRFWPQPAYEQGTLSNPLVCKLMETLGSERNRLTLTAKTERARRQALTIARPDRGHAFFLLSNFSRAL